MKQDHNQEIKCEFIELFGKPLTLDEAMSRHLKSAEEIAKDIKQDIAKRQEGEV